MRTKPYPSHHLIVEGANWSGVTQARREGVPWDSLRTRTGLPALGIAILTESPLAVQILLELGAPTETQTLFSDEPWSPLWAALTQGNADILDLVLQAGASPDEPHPQTQDHPLDAMAKQGNAACTIVLCNRGARPNTNSTPSPLWLWINHLAPQQDDTGTWYFPDARPILALIKAGVRVDTAKPHQMGVDSLSMAHKKWLKHPLPDSDQQHVKLVLAALERAALMEQPEIRNSRARGNGKDQSKM